jgi:F0F1-type ATP synthase assembly protein I
MPLPAKPSGELRNKKDPFVSLARYSEIGFILPSAVLLGFFLGKLLDYWLHTKWFYLAGLLFGAVVGFWQVIRMALGAFGKESDTDSTVDHNSGSSSRHV